jgi:hypothetical protein
VSRWATGGSLGRGLYLPHLPCSGRRACSRPRSRPSSARGQPACQIRREAGEDSRREPDLDRRNDRLRKRPRSRFILEVEFKRFLEVGQRLLDAPPLARYLYFDAASHVPDSMTCGPLGALPAGDRDYPRLLIRPGTLLSSAPDDASVQAAADASSIRGKLRPQAHLRSGYRGRGGTVRWCQARGGGSSVGGMGAGGAGSGGGGVAAACGR